MEYSTRSCRKDDQVRSGGEGLSGMQAVATTIMNRVHVSYGEYLRTGRDASGVSWSSRSVTCYMATVGGESIPRPLEQPAGADPL
jgi:N-acetylmuramoyl-L-alanine amidase